MDQDCDRRAGLPGAALTLTIGGAGLWVLVGLAWSVWIDPVALAAMPPDFVAAVIICTTVLVGIAWTRR